MDFQVFAWVYMDLKRICIDLKGISVIQELGCPAACGGLWRPVAACGRKLWPLYNAMLRGEGWQDGGWLDGCMAGWTWWASQL